jgi:hypothetical protein
MSHIAIPVRAPTQNDSISIKSSIVIQQTKRSQSATFSILEEALTKRSVAAAVAARADFRRTQAEDVLRSGYGFEPKAAKRAQNLSPIPNFLYGLTGDRFAIERETDFDVRSHKSQSTVNREIG